MMKAGTSGYGAGVAAAKSARAAANPSTTSTVTMDYYSGDNLHLGAQGQVQLGYDGYEKIFSAAHVST